MFYTTTYASPIGGLTLASDGANLVGLWSVSYTHLDVYKRQEPYCIVMPPPNITGQLHMGHALDCTIQDVLTRFKRMQGYCALWLPGTDHASIATEVKIVEQMAKEGVSKDDVGRDGFLQRAWADVYKRQPCSCAFPPAKRAPWQRQAPPAG